LKREKRKKIKEGAEMIFIEMYFTCPLPAKAAPFPSPPII
jgi:hypothetical protein